MIGPRKLRKKRKKQGAWNSHTHTHNSNILKFNQQIRLPFNLRQTADRPRMRAFSVT